MLSLEEAVADRARQIAHGWIEWPEVAVIGPEPQRSTVRANLSRAGIITATYLACNEKRQLAKALAAEAEYLVLIGPDGMLLRDRSTRLQQPTSRETVVDDAMSAILYDWRMSSSGADALLRAAEGCETHQALLFATSDAD